jgi:hypothetical protein
MATAHKAASAIAPSSGDHAMLTGEHLFPFTTLQSRETLHALPHFDY